LSEELKRRAGNIDGPESMLKTDKTPRAKMTQGEMASDGFWGLRFRIGRVAALQDELEGAGYWGGTLAVADGHWC